MEVALQYQAVEKALMNDYRRAAKAVKEELGEDVDDYQEASA